MPRVPCRSARQQLTAAACSALFRVRTPASARPDGLRRLPQQHSGRVLRRVCHARMRWCARLCTLRRMRRISLRHYEKKPALRQRRPRGAGRPALKWPMLRRPARPLFCAPPCTGRARTEKHAFFAGAIGSRPQAMPAACAVPAGACFPVCVSKQKFFTWPRHTGPASVFLQSRPCVKRVAYTGPEGVYYRQAS